MVSYFCLLLYSVLDIDGIPLGVVRTQKCHMFSYEGLDDNNLPLSHRVVFSFLAYLFIIVCVCEKLMPADLVGVFAKSALQLL